MKLKPLLLAFLAVGLALSLFMDPTRGETAPQSPPPPTTTPEGSPEALPQTHPQTLPEDHRLGQDAQGQLPGAGIGMLPGGARVAVIPISDEIRPFTLTSLKRRVGRALADGADLIVLELDTYGGQVIAALEICKYLKDAQAVPVPTVAWVHNKAYSAGILIASACDEIVMSPSSAAGDCAPIIPGMEVAPTERAKMFSPIAAEFRDNARRNGYDFATFHAMCELGVDLFLIEHKETGQRRVVNQVDYGLMVEGIDITQAASGWGALFGAGSAGKDPDMIEPVTREVARDVDRKQWVPVEQLPSGAAAPKGLIHASHLFTPNQTQAHDIGLSKATVSDDSELRGYLGAAGMVRYEHTWSEGLAKWLTSSAVRAVLIIALMLGAYVEFNTPGFGVGGTVAIVALVALIGAPFVIGLAEVWHVIVFFLGFVLLVIELAFVPSFGLLGILGLVMMFIGLVLAVIPTTGGGWFPLPAPGTLDQVLAQSLWMLGGAVVSMFGLVALTKYFGQIPGLNRLVLGAVQPALVSSEIGVGAQNPPTDSARTGATPGGGGGGGVSGDDAIGGGGIRVGLEGEVASAGLRPTGKARFGPVLADVVSLGAFVEPGSRVRVVEIHGNRIVVDQIQAG